VSGILWHIVYVFAVVAMVICPVAIVLGAWMRHVRRERKEIADRCYIRDNNLPPGTFIG
jgi:heme/copper-type cytochrome/quinol oxidase subunit 2